MSKKISKKKEIKYGERCALLPGSELRDNKGNKKANMKRKHNKQLGSRTDAVVSIKSTKKAKRKSTRDI